MEKYNLTQTGQEVQDILNNATPQSDLTVEVERAQEAERLLGEGIQQNADDIDAIEGKIPSAASSENKLTDKEYVDGQVDDEKNRAQDAEQQNADDIDAIEAIIPSNASPENKLATSNDVDTVAQSVGTEETRAKAAEKQNADDIDSLEAAIEAILLLIPTAASSLNKLADKAFVNSSIATNTATFRGTFNLVNDLHLTLAATHAQVGNALALAILESDNNDYAFVQIPTVETAPTEIAQTDRYKFNGSTWEYEYTLNNSGFTSAQWIAINSGITSALVTKLSALPTNADLTTALGVLTSSITTINQKIPSAASQANQLVDTAAMESYIVQVLDVLTASFNVTSSDGHVTVQISQVDGKITSVALTTLDIASAASLSLVEGRVTTAEGNISTNSADIAILQDAYAALTQSALVVIEPTDTWPVASPKEQTIYRVVDRTNTPPQYYSDYMWNGTVMVEMAQYNNAIDDVPTVGSNNLVKSGGVYEGIGKNSSFAVSNNTDFNKLVKELYTDLDIDFSQYSSLILSNKINSNYTLRLSGIGVADRLIQFPDTTNTIGYGNAIINGTSSHIFGIFDFSKLTDGEQYIFNECTISNRCKNLDFCPTIQSFINLQESLEPIILFTKDSLPVWDKSAKTLTFAAKSNVLLKNGTRFEMPTSPITITSSTDPWKLYLDTINRNLKLTTITDTSCRNSRYVLIGYGRRSEDIVNLSCGFKYVDLEKFGPLCPITLYSNINSPNFDSINNKLIFYFGTKFIDTGASFNTYQITDSSVEVSLADATNMWKLYIDRKNTVLYNQIVWYAVTYTTLVDTDRYMLVATGRSSEKTLTISCPYRIDGKHPWNIIYPFDYLRKTGYDNEDMIYTYWLYPQISKANVVRKALYFGYANSQKESGIAQYNIDRKEFKKNSMLVSSIADDHNAMATFVLEDGRILAAGSIHGLEDYLHIYITDMIQNIEVVNTDIMIPIYQVSYAQIFKVSSRYCIFCRSGAGVDSYWKIVYSDDLETWTVKNVVNAPNKKYYLCVREVTDDSNVLRIVMYENPSDIESDSNIRMGFINPSTGNIYDADETTILGTWDDGVNQNSFTIIIPKGTDRRNRIYDVAVTEKNNPVIAYADIYSYVFANYMVYKNGNLYNPCTSNYDTVSYSFGGMSFVGSENKVVASYHRTEQNDSDIIKIFEYNNSDDNYVSLRVLNTVQREGSKDIRELRPLCDKDGDFVMTFKGYYKYNSFFDWQTDIQIYDIR